MITLKHFLALIVLSILVLFGKPFFIDFLRLLGSTHGWFAAHLVFLFSWTHYSKLCSEILALTITPILIALVPAFIYWIFKRGEMPYLFLVMWVIWVILATVVAL